MPRTQGTPARRKSVLSIRWIVAGAAAILTTLVVLGVTAVMERRTRAVLLEEIESRTLVEARNLALASTRALLTDYPELLLAPLVKEMTLRQPELAFIAVVDRSGTVQGHPDVRAIGAPFTAPEKLTDVTSPVPRKDGETLTGNAAMLVASVPVLDPAGSVLGNAYVGMRRSHIEQAVSRVSRQQYLILAAFLATGVALTVVLMSILLRPIAVLRAGMERIGRGDLRTPVKLADRTEFGVLADSINEMSLSLQKAQGEMVERARLAHEMDLARQLQRSLLPSKQTVLGDFVIDGEQWAAAEVGGDYFDVLPLADGRVGLAIADVSGKGLAGCLVTSMLFSLLRAYHGAHSSPTALLVALDERLGSTLQRGSFVTMFYGVLDPRSGEVTYSSAGHNPILVYRADRKKAEWLPSKGIPLGAIRGGAIKRTLEDEVLHLDPGDVLLQFTDGISETTPPLSEEQFGFPRMEQVLLDAAPAGPREILERMHEAVERWREAGAPDDDETMLVVRRQTAAVAAAAEPLIGHGPAQALRRFAEAQASGVSLRLPADLESMSRIGEWLERSEVLRGLPGEVFGSLHLALYEACANIAEHGYKEDATKTIELYWVGSGSFLIRDQGIPFDPQSHNRPDFSDPDVRKRGRGLGIEIIRRVMKGVAYYPSTPLGNITVMEWDPGTQTPEEMARRG
ncbi:MAG TPA: SpoIIE family protein phosphatase [Candidatus Dormibacteraeota bacterium]|nr:SpoIIE family protein phosphatase [Candidatus Dormibacteraeota bacterium]